MVSNAVVSEVRLLVSDCVPVMTRDVVPWRLADHKDVESNGGISTLQHPNAAAFNASWVHRMVAVGNESCAKDIEASRRRMLLNEYDAIAVAVVATAAEPSSGSPIRPRPGLRLQKDTKVVGEGCNLCGN